jgi:predicted dithiol-disulfide oxidoreductase (DUF899 family)
LECLGLTLYQVVTPEEWRAARIALLAKEEAHNRAAAEIAAERRALPMVPVTKDYTFQGPDGPVTLKDLFGTKSQLIIYHYMFHPSAEEACHGCAFIVANLPDLRHLADKDTSIAIISRAPIQRITPWKEKNGWTVQWVSSYKTDFNYDYHVTLDEDIAPVEYNYKTKEELIAAGQTGDFREERPGLSVFKLEDGQVYHTYSTYSRIDSLASTYTFLDLTPAGRQEGPFGPAEFKVPAEYEEENRKYGR